ncbi:hypothetical protein E2C01_074804 [Portunus trituberculatus]|uniref:Uncharacterized protein n=1 Tax=Portunus trituberculatus TaxID=210409 RepID=A0A5B7I4E9_PORTR|nr:hypothetical protein [Portunus trituberculatus]
MDQRAASLATVWRPWAVRPSGILESRGRLQLPRKKRGGHEVGQAVDSMTLQPEQSLLDQGDDLDHDLAVDVWDRCRRRQQITRGTPSLHHLNIWS